MRGQPALALSHFNTLDMKASALLVVLLAFVVSLSLPFVADGAQLEAQAAVVQQDLTSSASAVAAAEPIRKVLNMLTAMHDKVHKEVDADKELFDKAMCTCKDNEDQLQRSIAVAQEKIPQLESSIQEDSATENQLTQDIQTHKVDKAKAEEELQTALELRQKELKAFTKASDEFMTNSAQLKAAIEVMTKAEAGGPVLFFQQNPDIADNIRALAASERFISSSREHKVIMDFLDENAGSSNLRGQQQLTGFSEISGILMQMLDGMIADQEQAKKDESKRVASYEVLKRAKETERDVAGQAIRDKDTRLSQTKVRLGDSRSDLETTQGTLSTDQKLYKMLSTSCLKKRDDYNTVHQALLTELEAIEETLGILNSGTAEALFKGTLPLPEAPPSFLQVARGNAAGKNDKHHKGKRHHKKHHSKKAVHPGVNSSDPVMQKLALLASKGSDKQQPTDLKSGLGQVPKLVEDMLKQLDAEQENDDTHYKMCKKEITTSDDRQEFLKQREEDLKADKATFQEQEGQVQQELTELQTTIQELDKDVKQATEARKEENAVYTDQLSAAHSAVQLLEIAKNRLRQFYESKEAQSVQFVEFKAKQGSTDVAASKQTDTTDIEATDDSEEEDSEAEQAEDSLAEPAETPAPTMQMQAADVEADDDQESSDDDSGEDEEDVEQPLAFIQEQEEDGSSDQADEENAEEEESEESVDTAEEDESQDTADEAAETVEESNETTSSNEPASGVKAVMTLIDQIQDDVNKEADDSKTAETDAQKEYEDYMTLSTDKRQADAKAVVDKEGSLALIKETLNQVDDKLSMTQREQLNLITVLSNLHKQCDSLLEHYDNRKTARRNEATSLRKASATLQGADVNA